MKRRKIKSGWKDYFNFSARERRGSLFLSSIIFIQIVILIVVKNTPSDFPEPDKEIVKSLMTAQNDTAGKKVFSKYTNHEEKSNHEFFTFNPNFLNDNSGIKLGLSNKQISVIKNYLSKGGVFRIKNDFKKMYCISDAQYKSLEPFIQLPDSITHVKMERIKTVFTPLKIDIGTADSVSLINLSGIGPVLASRIVKYREKLGGFITREQLKEVWGINDSLYEKLIPGIVLIDTIPFRYVHLNSDSFGIMAMHPYIKYKIAGLICNFRKQHQSINSPDELRNLPLLTEENFRKLAPYIRPD